MAAAEPYSCTKVCTRMSARTHHLSPAEPAPATVLVHLRSTAALVAWSSRVAAGMTMALCCSSLSVCQVQHVLLPAGCGGHVEGRGQQDPAGHPPAHHPHQDGPQHAGPRGGLWARRPQFCLCITLEQDPLRLCLSPADVVAWVSRHDIRVKAKTHVGGCQLSGRSLLALSAADRPARHGTRRCA